MVYLDIHILLYIFISIYVTKNLQKEAINLRDIDEYMKKGVY